MEKTFKEALENRRSYYAISDKSPVSNTEIEAIIDLAVRYVPSAFNSQSSRVVLLLGKHHKKLWDIVANSLKSIVPDAAFPATEKRIQSFAAGYGTVLYFEEQKVIESLQDAFPLYADNFPIWSQQTSAMHQFVIWSMLEEVGFGASLQHYNPLIDSQVIDQWKLPTSWKLIAQMPFGTPTGKPEDKTFQPIDERFFIFK